MISNSKRIRDWQENITFCFSFAIFISSLSWTDSEDANINT